ncbi:hypothetical protein LOTGIDRAFT_175931 [Lottia gigantea]|uniref:Uncharacterized protein n=1 Tax=Lottia gigantea TaxID=225164 RepID=V4A390_LOTGI|nr:hypothetical protein LOTGIDRAFT_175931 [Lottia gigantea]ESO87786.1 hypothetical protein LOTGIDRAFT_175931 [Lottia gigantea]
MSNKEQLFVITSNKSDIKLSLDYEYELDRNQEYELGLKYFSVYNSIRNINEKNNQIKISTDNGVTFKTIRLLPGSYEYIAINEYLSEYAGSVNGKNNIEFEEIFPNNPMLMCICGSSGSGKTHLTFNMLTTTNLLDFDSLYIYTTAPEQSYYQFLKTLEYLPKRDVQDLFQYYKENEEKVELKDFIDNYIEGMKPTDIKVFLTKNVNDLDLSQIDSERKNLILFDDCVAQRNQTVQQEFFTKGRHHNCHCIYQSQSFYGMDSMFIRKYANCFLLFELNDKDLSQIIQSINHGMDKDAFKKVCKAQLRNPDDHGYVFVNTRKPTGERVMTDIC